MRLSSTLPAPGAARRRGSRARWALPGLSLGGLLNLVCAPLAGASTFVPVSLAERVERAQLVVEATVVAIEHRRSDVVEPGDTEIPHTFVTFAVDHVVKGAHDGGDTLTLRFFGGEDGRGNATRIVGLPRFAVGDRELLFVRENGARMCPLVGWHQGRLRVVRDAVYDDAGFRVWLDPEGEISRGSERIDLSLPGYPALEPKQSHDGPLPILVPKEGSTPPDRAGMRAVLTAIDRAQRTASPNDPKVVRSVSIGEQFRAPSFTRRPPAAAESKDSKEAKAPRGS